MKSDHEAYPRPSDIDEFSREFDMFGLPSDSGLLQYAPARDMPWGMREAAIWDAYGNLLRAGQKMSKDQS